MIEIKLVNDSFNKVRETLTRMGVANQRSQTLYQSCHILKKFNKLKNENSYYIIHFKELMELDGKQIDLTDEDSIRTYSIAKTLESWGLVELVETYTEEPVMNFRIIKAAQKSDWTLKSKYVVGK